MDALEIFRMVATEFADLPDEDVREPDTGKIVSYGVRSFIREALWPHLSKGVSLPDGA